MIWTDFELGQLPVNLLAAANRNTFIGLVITVTIGITIPLVLIYRRDKRPWWSNWYFSLLVLYEIVVFFLFSKTLHTGLAVWATSTGIAALFTSSFVLAKAFRAWSGEHPDWQ